MRRTVYVDPDTPGVAKTYDIGGEEVLMHLGYALNCTRVLGNPDLACWYDVWAPAAGLVAFTALAILLLGCCVRDPH